MVSISSLGLLNLVLFMTVNIDNTSVNKAINENAPVIEKQHIFIPALPQKVWEILSDINNWPKWQPEVTHAELFGELQEGTQFKWKAGGISFTSELHTVDKHRVIGWTGKTIGTKAVHNWYLEEGNKGTTVYVEESLQGILPIFLKKKFSRDLHQGMKNNLQELYSACTLKTKEL